MPSKFIGDLGIFEVGDKKYARSHSSPLVIGTNGHRKWKENRTKIPANTYLLVVMSSIVGIPLFVRLHRPQRLRGKSQRSLRPEQQEEEEEEEPEDLHPVVRDECKEKKCCQAPRKHFEHCQEKVQRWGGIQGRGLCRGASTMMHCIDDCAAPKLFEKLV
ncbi:hypothetical protein FA13DRAFT_1781057 [Coprinellus micaceus]|uniref:Ubiquinol-cytochrome C reductase hinge domain-containing protein n=1 Tax=Coprinellus micaceus TaxID=71717 RepID=A0A4Y7SB32_COPMI|nr:hypothetical protein FA13DRAFT_1781057 [Coprinellus micaceus]